MSTPGKVGGKNDPGAYSSWRFPLVSQGLARPSAVSFACLSVSTLPFDLTTDSVPRQMFHVEADKHTKKFVPATEKKEETAGWTPNFPPTAQWRLTTEDRPDVLFPLADPRDPSLWPRRNFLSGWCSYAAFKRESTPAIVAGDKGTFRRLSRRSSRMFLPSQSHPEGRNKREYCAFYVKCFTRIRAGG